MTFGRSVIAKNRDNILLKAVLLIFLCCKVNFSTVMECPKSSMLHTALTFNVHSVKTGFKSLTHVADF